MVKYSKLLITVSLLLGPLGLATAQKSLSFIAAGQLHLMQPRFADEQLVSARIRLVPRVYRNWLVGVAADLSPRYAVQATVGLTSYGVAFVSQRDYRRSRFEYANVTANRVDAFEYALTISRRYLAAHRPSHWWFTDLGVDVVDIRATRGVSAFGFGSSDPNGPGIAGSGRTIDSSPYRVGLRLGGGHEWALSKHHNVAVQALASFGLRDLQRYHLSSVVWQQGQSIDPITYENTLATRFSFVGVQARYRFQW